jgi:leader peptidase (prepilin peptidase) / N-methyltransferase
MELANPFELFALPPRELPFEIAFLVLGWAFIVAATLGSFLNVVIARVPAGQSVVTPRSRCPKCGTQILARDNIPVLSWVLLGAKCRTCKAPISARYPVIELLVGLLGATLVFKHGLGFAALEMFVFSTILIAIAFVDIDTWLVPDPLWIALVASGAGFAGLDYWRTGSLEALISRGVGAVGAGVLLSAVVVAATGILRRTGRLKPDEWAMGWGDPLILVGIGAFLGWELMPMVLFFASVQGSVVGIALKLSGKLVYDKPVSPDDDWIPPPGALPFGPFLALGGIEAAFFGRMILDQALALFVIS